MNENIFKGVFTMKKLLKKLLVSMFTLMVCISAIGVSSTESHASSYGTVKLKVVVKQNYQPGNYLTATVTNGSLSNRLQTSSRTISNLKKGSTYTSTITGTKGTLSTNSTLKVTYFSPTGGKKTKTITLTPSDFRKNRTKTITISTFGNLS